MARLPKVKLGRARSPGDYEAELVRLCKGNRREAERLIAEEQQKSPELSRQGAALALVTRIRHEREPRRRPL
jgi:glucose-6-phosphate dehydrogenase assembly protein OpcA